MPDRLADADQASIAAFATYLRAAGMSASEVAVRTAMARSRRDSEAVECSEPIGPDLNDPASRRDDLRRAAVELGIRVSRGRREARAAADAADDSARRHAGSAEGALAATDDATRPASRDQRSGSDGKGDDGPSDDEHQKIVRDDAQAGSEAATPPPFQIDGALEPADYFTADCAFKSKVADTLKGCLRGSHIPPSLQRRLNKWASAADALASFFDVDDLCIAAGHHPEVVIPADAWLRRVTPAEPQLQLALEEATA